MDKVKYPRVFLGTTNENRRCYLQAPSWDCGWYWGWGYTSVFHLSYLSKKTNMFESIKSEFKTFVITDNKDLWTFCELVRTFYHLQATAEVLVRGGSHYTNNPCQKLIKDADYAKHINTVLMPAIFVETYKLFEKVN